MTKRDYVFRVPSKYSVNAIYFAGFVLLAALILVWCWCAS